MADLLITHGLTACSSIAYQALTAMKSWQYSKGTHPGSTPPPKKTLEKLLSPWNNHHEFSHKSSTWLTVKHAGFTNS